MGMQNVDSHDTGLINGHHIGEVGVLAGPALIGYVSHSLSIIAAFTMLAGLLTHKRGIVILCVSIDQITLGKLSPYTICSCVHRYVWVLK